MKKIRFGIIGAGRLGNVHAGKLALLDEAELAGVYDVNPDAAQAMREKYGVKIYHSAAELAGAADIDGIIVASPTYCHLEGIRAAVGANKALFCEKPLTRTLEDASEALTLLQAYPKVFSVGFVRRYMTKSRKIKQLLAEGLIGKVRYCNVDLPFGKYARMYGDWFTDFDKCGGVIIDMLAHHVDLANWFFGEALSVYAAGMLLDPVQELPSDYAAGIVKYKNGVICNLMCSWQRFGRSGEIMEICGEKGALVMDGSDIITFYPLNGEKQPIDVSTAAEAAKGVEQVNTGNAFLIEAKHLVTAVKGGSVKDMPTVHDAFRSLEIGLAMIESARSNSVILLPLKQ
ncbi:MAG: Gfo/Idh/MocA family oxidoreductase [Victivallaceae bacterium]|nr:Gfo/Idh/MocA family oxidoreductase [Victivallaceae bacterium]